MPTQAEMKATMVKYVERVNAGDADGVVALYADGATIEDPVGSPPRADRAAITELYRNAVATNVRLKILAGPFGSFANAAAASRSAAPTHGNSQPTGQTISAKVTVTGGDSTISV